MRCPNCGAKLVHGVCEYCGYDNGIRGSLEDRTGVLCIDGKEYKVVLEEIEVKRGEVVRDYEGRLYQVGNSVMRFTLVTV